MLISNKLCLQKSLKNGRKGKRPERKKCSLKTSKLLLYEIKKIFNAFKGLVFQIKNKDIDD